MPGPLKHPNQHPLKRLFAARKMTEREGMNALQEGPILLISDNCVTADDVAPCDTRAVLERAGALMMLDYETMNAMRVRRS